MNCEQRTTNYEHRPPHKPPILPNLPTIYNLFMQNKPNFQKSQMSVSIFSQRAYKNTPDWTLGENKPNSNPISKQLQSPICPGHLLINRMNQICCVCGLTVSFDSAKMAQYTGNLEFEKRRQKKLNLLKCKRLNSPGRLRPLTGTLFAHSYSRNFLYTDDNQ